MKEKQNKTCLVYCDLQTPTKLFLTPRLPKPKLKTTYFFISQAVQYIDVMFMLILAVLKNNSHGFLKTFEQENVC